MWPNSQETADLVTFTKENLNGKPHFCAVQLNKTIGLLRILQNLLSRSTLIIIYIAFVRPHLGYGDILYDQTYNSFFHKKKLETIQYNACLTLTGAVRGFFERENISRIWFWVTLSSLLVQESFPFSWSL